MFRVREVSISPQMEYKVKRIAKRGEKRAVTSEGSAKKVDLRLLAKIISSYLANNKVEPGQIPVLIASVERALGGLGKAPGAQPAPQPAVPIRRSVQSDHVVCLECGFKAKTLRRHLKARHNLEIGEYLARWGLPADHPLTAPAYSEQRSAMAKRIGLGMRRDGRRRRRRRNEG